MERMYYFVLEPWNVAKRASTTVVHQRPPIRHNEHASMVENIRSSRSPPHVLRFGPRRSRSGQSQTDIEVENDGQQNSAAAVMQRESPRSTSHDELAEVGPSSKKTVVVPSTMPTSRSPHAAVAAFSSSRIDNDDEGADLDYTNENAGSQRRQLRSAAVKSPRQHPHSSATVASPSDRRNTNRSISPELQVAPLGLSSDNTYHPKTAPATEKYDEAAQRKRLAALEEAGIALLEAHQAMHPGEASPNDQTSPPRWLVLHRMAEHLQNKRQSAVEEHEMELAVLEKAEAFWIQSQQEKLRASLAVIPSSSKSSSHIPRGTSSSTSVSVRTVSPASNSFEPHQEGLEDRPLRKREVPPELAKIMYEKANASILHPVVEQRSREDDSSSRSHVASRKRRGSNAGPSSAAVARSTSQQSHASEESLPEPPSTSPPMPSSVSPGRRNIIPAVVDEGASSTHQDPTNTTATRSISSEGKRQATFRRPVYQDTDCTFRPMITRGPTREYYEKKGFVVVNNSTTQEIQQDAHGAEVEQIRCQEQNEEADEERVVEVSAEVEPPINVDQKPAVLAADADTTERVEE